ncbi:MAG: NAD-dependent epimerase/dehydratase family protein [Proteobacteria bacterium]|nr:NAD-dependent epimerase/dehydratase family protein [Pseudomonadota bacterium]
MTAKFRVGLVGAGGISEYHVYGVRAAPQCTLVGVFDIDQARAAELGDRLGVDTFPSMKAMRDAGVNVIHVLTPPSTHVPVALEALDLGCHVFIEKPLAEDEGEAEKVRKTARQTGLVASVNHSLLFDPQVMRALQLARSGALGKVISVDILRGSEYPPYEGGRLPPHYRGGAGYPFRDLGVHCYYLLQAFLGSIEHVTAEWESLGGDPNLAFDEWRALVRCKNGLGQFQISYNTKPMQSQLIVHGTRSVLRVDLFTMFHARRSNTPLPKAAERLVNAMTDSIQPMIDVPVNVVRFVRKKVQAYQGLRDHIAAFYRALEAGQPAPVSLDDAIEVIRWTEEVAREAEKDHAARLARFELSPRVPVLVTGASGSLGGAVVRRLLEQGKRVRIFVRRIPEKVPDGVEVAFGNLGDPDAVDRAVAGAEMVIHVGAAMKGGPLDHHCATVVGTQNVLDACEKHGVGKLVHISSMSVVDWAGSSDGSPVSESTELEPHPEERGPYTQSKLKAENLVVAAAEAGKVASVILRPGQIFGGGIPVLTGAVARRAGSRWLILGDGELPLPLVYIDDVVDAIMAAADSDLRGGEIVQIIDTEVLTQNQVLDLMDGKSSVLRIRRPIVFLAGRMSEPVFRALGRQSPVALYRLKSAMARLQFAGDHAQSLLSWQPRVGVREGLRRELAAQQ